MLPHQDRCRIFGYRIPHYFWFALSGALCDIVQGFVDYGIYLIYPFEFEKTTVCWTASYTASIFIRHFSHRILVFGEYEGSYCSSLLRTYMTYSSSIVISMVSNHFIVAFFEAGHLYAWIITMLWTGIYTSATNIDTEVTSLCYVDVNDISAYMFYWLHHVLYVRFLYIITATIF